MEFIVDLVTVIHELDIISERDLLILKVVGQFCVVTLELLLSSLSLALGLPPYAQLSLKVDEALFD